MKLRIADGFAQSDEIMSVCRSTGKSVHLFTHPHLSSPTVLNGLKLSANWIQLA
jgi:hypothetical protein